MMKSAYEYVTHLGKQLHEGRLVLPVGYALVVTSDRDGKVLFTELEDQGDDQPGRIILERERDP